MAFLRYLILLALVAWLGSLIFFSFVVAPSAFAVLPTRHLAGAVVTRTLSTLHWIGIASGIVFLVSSMLYSRMATGWAHAFSARHVLVILMLLLTCISQFGVSPRMHALRVSVGEIDAVPADNPARVQFNALHQWSTRLEGGVFLLGLVLVYLTAQRFA